MREVNRSGLRVETTVEYKHNVKEEEGGLTHKVHIYLEYHSV
jgi:hypothetical protein